MARRWRALLSPPDALRRLPHCLDRVVVEGEPELVKYGLLPPSLLAAGRTIEVAVRGRMDMNAGMQRLGVAFRAGEASARERAGHGRPPHLRPATR
jgi:hypothetical protein